jgi:hypothetical protein
MGIKITDDKITEVLLEFAQASTGRSADVLREAADRIKSQGERITRVKREHRILKDMISRCVIDTTGPNGFKCPTCMHLHERLGREENPCLDCLRDIRYPSYLAVQEVHHV